MTRPPACVHTGSVVAAAWLLPVLCFYMEFTFDD